MQSALSPHLPLSDGQGLRTRSSRGSPRLSLKSYELKGGGRLLVWIVPQQEWSDVSGGAQIKHGSNYCPLGSAMLAKSDSAPTFAFSTKFILFFLFLHVQQLIIQCVFPLVHYNANIVLKKSWLILLKKLCVPLCVKTPMEGGEQLCRVGSLLDLCAGSGHQIQVFRLV